MFKEWLRKYVINTIKPNFGLLLDPAHKMLTFITYALKPPLSAFAYPMKIEEIFVRAFILIHTLCMLAAKALARLRICAGSPE